MDRVFGGRAEARLDYADIPSVVFSHPPLGKVGLTEAEARALHGDGVQVFRAGFVPMLESLAGSGRRSLFKVVCAGVERRVLGIHLLGDGASRAALGSLLVNFFFELAAPIPNPAKRRRDAVLPVSNGGGHVARVAPALEAHGVGARQQL